uniref:hypothetical protein n=1 Tax=Castellaniella defragrans TaxID=75697 RepID=UPI0033428957
MSKTHWKTLINPDYLGAYSIPEGEDLTVVIDYVRSEEITGTNGKKEVCSVAHIKGNKPWILNMTNQKTIARLYGPYIEDWQGKAVTLYASTTKLAGEAVECIRVRPKVVSRKKDAIPDERLAKAIDSIKAGSYTIEKLRANFTLTAAQEKQLAEAMNAEPAAV